MKSSNWVSRFSSDDAMVVRNGVEWRIGGEGQRKGRKKKGYKTETGQDYYSATSASVPASFEVFCGELILFFSLSLKGTHVTASKMTLKNGCHRLMYSLTHQSSMLAARSRGHLLLQRLDSLQSKTRGSSSSWISTSSAQNMRLVQFTDRNGGPQKLGVQPQQDGEITDISTGSGKIPNDLIKLIQGGPDLWAEAERYLEFTVRICAY